ncbi:sulfonate ABC transporter permease [Methylovirgula ligni]|uniref:NitT/TauT family transport system permease protein n=2 Tax=Methylovirgula ligni TaxID=569860 RepID=A0A3D9ZBJ2_9HYPH|nr:sulfonate ABC transporter permease [Methylovirgula ligni]REF88836.1 NitT/TauT family transport system permease protein [Methylovirgula ligni]
MSRPIWLKPPLFLRSQQHHVGPRVYAPGRPRLALPADSLELTVAAIVLALAAMLAYGISEVFAPVSSLKAISLDPLRLPEYAVRTVLRMLAAMGASLLFTLVYGTLAAKSRRAEVVLVPLLDILQSVPVLGYLSFTVVFFVGLAPHWVLGLELASIFAIFTSQAWNMAFSFFQALRTLPVDLDEASRAFGFSAWQRFWRLEFPFAVPGLVWNMMMSMSGGWFFVVASEAITADQRQIALPGIGSYVALAIAQRNLLAIGFAIAAMTIVILIYDQLLFRPLVVWADRFRVEQTASQSTPHSWFLELLRHSHLARAAAVPASFCLRRLFRARILNIIPTSRPLAVRSRASKAVDDLWYIFVAVASLGIAAIIVRFIAQGAGWSDVFTVVRLGTYTLLRVVVLIVLASLIWVPVGVVIGLRPKLAERVQPLAQFLAAFPANLLFPLFVIPIVRFNLNTDIWLTPLMILGTQWYILFNVIAGTTALPTDLLEAADNFRFHGWQWWRIVILPGIFPYYITGAITASGGAWNASIVAEVVSWGHDRLFAHGLGAYISQMTAQGDYPRIVLGIATMSAFVVLFNRLLWRPLYAYGERRFRLD